ncbi:hypothetical protein A2U01_0050810, partial [Trifolium medium]|nr:hypothetical protein [Trifolium medium]
FCYGGSMSWNMVFSWLDGPSYLGYYPSLYS